MPNALGMPLVTGTADENECPLVHRDIAWDESNFLFHNWLFNSKYQIGSNSSLLSNRGTKSTIF